MSANTIRLWSSQTIKHDNRLVICIFKSTKPWVFTFKIHDKKAANIQTGQFFFNLFTKGGGSHTVTPPWIHHCYAKNRPTPSWQIPKAFTIYLKIKKEWIPNIYLKNDTLEQSFRGSRKNPIKPTKTRIKLYFWKKQGKM